MGGPGGQMGGPMGGMGPMGPGNMMQGYQGGWSSTPQSQYPGYGTPSGPGGFQGWGAPPGPQGQGMAPPTWGSNYAPPQQPGYGSYGKHIFYLYLHTLLIPNTKFIFIHLLCNNSTSSTSTVKLRK